MHPITYWFHIKSQKNSYFKSLQFCTSDYRYTISRSNWLLIFTILSTSIYDLVLIYVYHFHHHFLLLQWPLFKFDHYRDTRASILDPCIQGIFLFKFIFFFQIPRTRCSRWHPRMPNFEGIQMRNCHQGIQQGGRMQTMAC